MTFGDDSESTQFMYDGWVYLASSAVDVANLEMYLNRTMHNGQTVIFGFQCDGYLGLHGEFGSPSEIDQPWCVK